MKTLRIIGLALVAVVLSATLVSCSDDEGNSESPTIITSTSVNVETPGTLKLLLGDKVQTITSLKITGSINGDDVTCLHQMLRCTNEDIDNRGMLSILDISDASIVSGGDRNIDKYLFADCECLEEIALPQNRDVIGEGDFEDCIGLKNVIIPDKVANVSTRAFFGCTSVLSISIPKNVTSIGSYAFYECKSLADVALGNSVKTIWDYAFYGCESLTEVTIPNSVTSIWTYAFGDCSSLTEVTIGNSVTSIRSYAFYNCSSLMEVTSLNPEPPSCNGSSFGTITSTGVLYVPKGSKEAYSTATCWKDFQNIVEIDV